MIDSGLKYNWIGYVRHTGPTRSMHDNHSIVFGKPLLWFFKGDKLSGDYVSDFIESKPPNKALDDWAQSPVEAEHYIWPLTVENQIVFDPFMGSGTFGIAALKLKRQFIGIDKTPKRFEVAKSNLERISQSEKELSA